MKMKMGRPEDEKGIFLREYSFKGPQTKIFLFINKKPIGLGRLQVAQLFFPVSSHVKHLQPAISE